jgi:SagB-type dehydrogenase family enzyme
MQIHSLASGAVLTTDDPAIVRLLHAFAHPRTLDDAARELDLEQEKHWLASIVDLVKAAILVPAAEADDATAHGWDWSALAYHRCSRDTRFRKTGVHASAVERPSSSLAIPLARTFPERASTLPELLAARKSFREWPREAIAFEKFSELLWLSARDRTTGDETADHASRPYPSGGGTYSLQIYAVIGDDAVDGLQPGLYRYSPRQHALEPVPSSAVDRARFLESAAASAGSALPPVLFLMTSRYALLAGDYGVIAYGLVLKEVGCLFQTLYLAAEYLALGACALGGGVSGGRLARIAGFSELSEPLVGEFAVGLR